MSAVAEGHAESTCLMSWINAGEQLNNLKSSPGNPYSVCNFVSMIDKHDPSKSAGLKIDQSPPSTQNYQ